MDHDEALARLKREILEKLTARSIVLKAGQNAEVTVAPSASASQQNTQSKEGSKISSSTIGKHVDKKNNVAQELTKQNGRLSKGKGEEREVVNVEQVQGNGREHGKGKQENAMKDKDGASMRGKKGKEGAVPAGEDAAARNNGKGTRSNDEQIHPNYASNGKGRKGQYTNDEGSQFKRDDRMQRGDRGRSRFQRGGRRQYVRSGRGSPQHRGVDRSQRGRAGTRHFRGRKTPSGRPQQQERRGSIRGQEQRFRGQGPRLGREPQNRSPAVPEWRRFNKEEEKKDAETVEDLLKLNKDLDWGVNLFQNGSVGGNRVAMSRLQSAEENKWAFLDESDVSDFADRVPEPAMKFPFELDDFQKRAILQVEKQNSVFVAAHTSAGKTVVAEYAISLAAAFGDKVFYTSPIKTLSNQKLRDFREKFDDVGLVTGDVSIDDDAQCVIMTTEVLRSMLYRGADVIRDVSYVIFDEVQFLNDEERGVVWEESIIMLPPHIGIIMLSATVPNALEFASWVGKTKDRKVAVVSTSKRPVPLQHSWLYRQRGSPDELCEAVLLKQGGQFLSENFRNALGAGSSKKEHSSANGEFGKKKTEQRGKNEEDGAQSEGTGIADNNGVVKGSLEEGQIAKDKRKKSVMKGSNKNKGPSMNLEAAAGTNKGGRGPNSLRSPWAPLVRFLHKNERTPSVVFCFSKKKCEKAVEDLESIDLLPNASDKAFVHQFFEGAILKLREEDRGLPQVLRVRSNLKRGFAAHHAGLLPLIKEITEILFSKGLLKVLFATETFAMGVNMPARTVVFAAVRKNDGRRFRYLQAGEYTQMSGRAGRRGLDTLGYVYLFFPPPEKIPDERNLARVMTGDPISLKSAFRLTYNMILNVLRVDELRVEEMMKQSFSEAGEDSRTLGIAALLKKAGDALDKHSISAIEAKPTTATKTNNTGGQSNGENSLRIYATKFAQLLVASSELKFWELNGIFRLSVKPGRVVLAEVQPGFISLCVVYSVIPSKKSPGAPTKNQTVTRPIVRRETQLWVASISAVASSAVAKHVPSVLLLPEPRMGKRPMDYQPIVRVVSSDGLVVVLNQIEASKIVYICDELDDVTTDREEEQAHAAKQWHFVKKAAAVKKTLMLNASYIQSVVAKWKQNAIKGEVGSAGAFLDEMMVTGTLPKSGNNAAECAGDPKRAGRRKMINDVPEAYRRRVKICLELVTDPDLANAVREGGGLRLASKIGKLVLAESVRGRMTALKMISDAGREPSLLPEYHSRVKVLQALDYVDEDGMSVKLKGRCGCSVATTDSVVLTEIILDNILDDLGCAEVASLLSSLVCRKKNSNEIHDEDSTLYSQAYRDAKKGMREVVEKFGKAQEECGVELAFDIADGGDSYEGAICRWDLAQAVYAWAMGEAFFNITDLTQQQEGDIVVCVKRLIELLRDAQSVAKGVGNLDLLAVLEKAVEMIRRDVIFNGSLYYDRETRRSGNGDKEQDGVKEETEGDEETDLEEECRIEDEIKVDDGDDVQGKREIDEIEVDNQGEVKADGEVWDDCEGSEIKNNGKVLDEGEKQNCKDNADVLD